MVLFGLWALGSGLNWNGCDVDGSEVTPGENIEIFMTGEMEIDFQRSKERKYRF